MDAIADLANEGIPHMVVDGTGKVYGRYVIIDVKETRSTMLDDLRPRRVDFSITLKHYGQDG
jgi:phage protein U